MAQSVGALGCGPKELGSTPSHLTEKDNTDNGERMLIAVLVTLFMLNILTGFALYRVWVWVKLSAAIGHPFALVGSTVAMEQALKVLTQK